MIALSKSLPLAAAALGFAGLTSADASVLFTLNNGNSYQVEYVAGTGSKTAVLEVAFSSTQYALFGYRWDANPAPFASSMISDISAAETDTQTGSSIGTPLAVDSSDYGWGIFYTGFTYGSLSGISDYEKDGTWWGYFYSSNGVNWISPETYGASGSVVADNSFQAMAFGSGFDFTPVSVSAVPEPSSLGILIVTLLMAHRRR